MDNKILFISAVITAVGVIIAPTHHTRKKVRSDKDSIELEAEQLLEEMKDRNVKETTILFDSLSSKPKTKVIIKKVFINDTIYITKDNGTEIQ